MKGTPSTLIQSIENGILDESQRMSISSETIEHHVQDFLAQRFGAAILLADSDKSAEALSHLYYEITGRKVRR